MIKRTLLFGNPAYLSTKNEQLVIKYPDEGQDSKTVAIEDIGVLLLEDPQITITSGLLDKLTANQTAIITCDRSHMPTGLLMPLSGHSEQQERFRAQLGASEPLKKNLWQQTIQAKIKNQALHLKSRGTAMDNMLHWAKNVTSGDGQNHEARAAAYYWQHLFDIPTFNRHAAGEAPNNLLNYGYAILRAICARALVSSGLLPLLGIHHKNKYNAYCLADDIMEPYRPYVDLIVCHIVDNQDDFDTLTTSLKKELLQIPVLDVSIDDKKSPLMVAMSRTTSSLYDCFAGHSRKIVYPDF
ncbi:MAG: subtype II CRISPR-associated endonuclease Cas1 [Cytophagales bacterium CG12_big_fil_rev_8_21_14_0_65_40_12]|nr:MAG: subtype II CRISPR-associated endonuclease Cas1 [Cytophagales bacterium CG12_big_fil_rev_8_21_14_0_65_40_12]PIW04594.1 MAG: type II CRISPR-associated endonuclease Cas1 [Cytophagales bacterium CG17_big_fil_post_rev_8_21_14_2_50_40_13]